VARDERVKETSGEEVIIHIFIVYPCVCVCVCVLVFVGEEEE